MATNFFFELTPDAVLNSVENALDLVAKQNRATGRIFTLNSLENRVYEIELEDNSKIVAKFYRPGRWSKEQILEEHRFLNELQSNEIPVAAPLSHNAQTLWEFKSIYFAVFPKIRGRILNELTRDQLSQVGRYLGRIHNVGAQYKALHRIQLSSESLVLPALHSLESFLIQYPDLSSDTKQSIERYITTAKSKLSDLCLPKHETLRIHGDCHLGNLLWTEQGLTFLDFDDFVMGPAVQDIWLVVRGNDEQAFRDRDILLSGYEQMRSFPHEELAWIEKLRMIRMIHYNGWIAKRWDDPIFKHTFPGFIHLKHWSEEIEGLYENS